MDSFRVLEDEKNIIYKYLAAILHLGNVTFETIELETQITELTRKHIIIAAQLLNIDPEKLKKAILFRKIEVAGSVIM